MASLFKRNRHELLPVGAVLSESEDQRIARWIDEKGKTRHARVNSAGNKIVLPPAKDDPYYIAYEDENGRRRTVKAYRDKESAAAMGKRLEDESAKRKEGLVDTFSQHRHTPINQHIEVFFAGQRSKRAPQKKMQINRIVAGTKASRVHELDTPQIEQFLQTCQTKETMADRTVNEYIASIKEFTKWAVTNRRISTDPLAGLKRISPKAISPVHPRRALTMEDIAKLLDAAKKRPLMEMRLIRHGPRKGEPAANLRSAAIEYGQLLGRERRLAYMLAFYGRLRRSEINALKWGDIHFNASPPKIKLRAHTTKSKRADTVPLHVQLDEELQAFRPKTASSSQKVIRTVPNMKVLRADLKLAGIEDIDAEGLYADLHALGKSFITAMAASGVSQRAAQAIARHTDPRLTANAYTDENLLPLAAEMAKVPRIPTIPLPFSPTSISDAVLKSDKGYSTNNGGQNVDIDRDVTGQVRAGDRPESSVMPVIPSIHDVPDNRSRAAPAQRNCDFACHLEAQHDTNGTRADDLGGHRNIELQVKLNSGDDTKWHDPAPHVTGSFIEAGEGGRTLDIHVGNVTLYH